MNNKKSKDGRVFVICILLLLLMFSFFSSSAFFAKSIKTDNIISFGELKLQLINNTLDEKGREIAVTTENEKIKSSKVSRIIKVKNVCDNSMYVRVKIDLTGIKDQTTFNADSYAKYSFDDKKWKKQGAWFYYLTELNPNEITGNLIEKLEFDMDSLGSDFPGSTVTLKVSAQAVQSNHNSSVLEAQGWPEED